MSWKPPNPQDNNYHSNFLDYTSALYRVAPVRFGYGLGMERFEQFRFLVPAVPLRRGFSVQFDREDGSGSGSWKMVPAVPVPRSVPSKNGSDGSGFLFQFGSWATLILFFRN